MRFLIKAVTFDMWKTLIKDKDYADQRIACLDDALRKSDISINYDEVRNAYNASYIHAYEIQKVENYRYVTTNERLNFILERSSIQLAKELKMKVLKKIEEVAVSLFRMFCMPS